VKSRNSRWLFRCINLFVVVMILPAAAGADKGDEQDTAAAFISFHDALEAGDDAAAKSLGESVLKRLDEKYRSDTGFRAFMSKLRAAEFVAEQMVSQLNRAKAERLKRLATELFDNERGAGATGSSSAAPAKRFFECSQKLFSNPVSIAGIDADEKVFLARYYDFRLRLLTTSVAKAGQALVIAEPSFKQTHDYVLVLPLLHVSGAKSVSIDVLPTWMCSAEHLDVFSDSCLLHFLSPFQAMGLAQRAAEMRNEPFSEMDFYRLSAKKCGRKYPNVAVDCLREAMKYAQADDDDALVELHFEIVRMWLDSKNHALAASEARHIFELFGQHKRAGEAVWLHFYALSRSNRVDEILSDIDVALADERCVSYRPKLMYIKWWAFRRKREHSAVVASLEYELLSNYGSDPMVAPILLSQATDQLAGQQHNVAYESLRQLVRKFPSTKAAAQATKILEKLKNSNSGG